MSFTIGMDGPVGAGKSTVANAVSAGLGILHLDTGAMYRAVGLTAIKRGIDLKDEQAVTELCRKLRMSVAYVDGAQRTMVDDEDVSGSLRLEEVGAAASAVARYAGVRTCMVAIQRQLAETTDMLMDGRDICTVVLPNASLKIYLTASAEERARRRYEELKAKGSDESYEQVLRDLQARDAQDMNREIDPLRPAEDSVIVDTTGLSFDESVQKIIALAEAAGFSRKV